MAPISYSGYRFPRDVIQRAVWMYVRFTLNFRDVEDLLAERGIVVSYETIRRWVASFGPAIARRLRRGTLPRIRDGTSTKCSSGSAGDRCTCGEPSMRRVRSSTCSCRQGGTRLPCSSQNLI